MPKLKDDAEKRASEIAISQRRYLQYSVYFPEGRHRLRVKDAERRERKSLLSAAHDRVLAVRDSSRAMGEYYEVRIPYDGEMLRWHSFTDWDGDGDDDLFFWYALLGHEVHDGRTPVANRIGAIENRDGVGVFVTDAEHSEFYRNGIHSIGDLSATGSTIRAVASRMDWEDRILTIEFDGSRFVYAGDRPNDGTREVQTSGGFIIGD